MYSELWIQMYKQAHRSQSSSCSTGLSPLRTIGSQTQMIRLSPSTGQAEVTMYGSVTTEEIWTRPFPSQPVTQTHTSIASKNLAPTTSLPKSIWCWESQVSPSWHTWDILKAVPKWCTLSPQIKTTLLIELICFSPSLQLQECRVQIPQLGSYQNRSRPTNLPSKRWTYTLSSTRARWPKWTTFLALICSELRLKYCTIALCEWLDLETILPTTRIWLMLRMLGSQRSHQSKKLTIMHRSWTQVNSRSLTTASTATWLITDSQQYLRSQLTLSPKFQWPCLLEGKMCWQTHLIANGSAPKSNPWSITRRSPHTNTALSMSLMM